MEYIFSLCGPLAGVYDYSLLFTPSVLTGNKISGLVGRWLGDGKLLVAVGSVCHSIRICTMLW